MCGIDGIWKTHITSSWREEVDKYEGFMMVAEQEGKLFLFKKTYTKNTKKVKKI